MVFLSTYVINFPLSASCYVRNLHSLTSLSWIETKAISFDGTIETHRDWSVSLDTV